MTTTQRDSESRYFKQYAISVKDLVEFSCRTGDLRFSRRKTPTAKQGVEAHQKIQKKRAKKYQDNYRQEVSVQQSHVSRSEEFQLIVRGRIDGVIDTKDEFIIEEIKSTYFQVDDIPQDQLNIHWAQLKIYAYLFCEEHALQQCHLHLTYLNLDTDKASTIIDEVDVTTLKAFYDNAVSSYLSWLEKLTQHYRDRNESIKRLEFPFQEYRPGQRELAVACYKTLSLKTQLLAQAPTGIGKTVSTLFPTLKAISEEKTDRIAYCTAKTSGQHIASDAISMLEKQGLIAKSLTLTARDKICFCQNTSSTEDECVYKQDYFDKLSKAREEVFHIQHLNREAIVDIADRHQLCPFEFSLDIAHWMDLIICDYNYVFDPRVSLSLFDDTHINTSLLIDECHNLVDRSRQMYSTEISKQDFQNLTKIVSPYSKPLEKSLKAISKHLNALKKHPDIETIETYASRNSPESFQRISSIPDQLIFALQVFCRETDLYFEGRVNTLIDEPIREVFFSAHHFLRICEYVNDNYALLVIEKSVSPSKKKKTLICQLLCLDAAPLLNATYNQIHSSILFSATLSPMAYFHSVLGLGPESVDLELPYPFEPDNLKICIANHIKTTFKERDAYFDATLEIIIETINCQQGNYLVYVPSYQYLNKLEQALHSLDGESALTNNIISQTPGMDDEAKQGFINQLKENDSSYPTLGLCIIGGLFGEGIDLPGDQLIGVIIIGVGLPNISVERDLIQRYFNATVATDDSRESHNSSTYLSNPSVQRGYEYAYQYPGFSRVLQTAGRTIRTAHDKGIVVLIDDRFSQSRYQKLFPVHWHPTFINSVRELQSELDTFWTTQPQVMIDENEQG